MPQPEQYDALIFGSGQGGKLLAWELARSGRKTACVERKWVGGSCPNIACLPSKNEIWSAKVDHLARHGAQFGVVTGPVTTDMATVLKRKRDMVQREIEAHLRNYKTTGAELIIGNGRFVAPKTLEVHLNDGATRVLAGDRVFLNVGTHAAIPPVPGLETARPLTNIEALELDYAPAHLIVLGAGYVGLELAQAYRRFGSRVTVIEPGPQPMGREDADVVTDRDGLRLDRKAGDRLVPPLGQHVVQQDRVHAPDHQVAVRMHVVFVRHHVQTVRRQVGTSRATGGLTPRGKRRGQPQAPFVREEMGHAQSYELVGGAGGDRDRLHGGDHPRPGA